MDILCFDKATHCRYSGTGVVFGFKLKYFSDFKKEK